MITHFTFNTYKGKHILDREFEKFLMKSFNEIAKDKGFEILTCSILSDHVHILIKHDKLSNAKIMQFLKGISARNFFIKYPSNRHVDRKLWGRSYFYRKIPENQYHKVLKYLKNQWTKEGIDKRYN